jgi:N-acetylmuramoyl-L-alanine amidase
MKVIQNLVPTSKYNIKCPYPMVAEFIVVHNTANDASARNEVAYMIRNNDKVSFHYAIDDKEIIQGIPENRNAWHAGDGANGQGNRKGLSVEICYSKSGGKRFEEAEKLAAKFIAYKLKEKGWGIDKVKKHQDFSNKYCPHRTLDMGWQRFLNIVQAELNNLTKGDDKVADKSAPSHWAKDAWEWAKKEGLLDGTRPKDNLTREEFAVVLKRLADKK